MLSDIFKPFIEGSPLSVMMRNYQRIPPVWRGLTLDLEGGSGQAYAWVGPPRPDAPGLPNAALVFILTS